jgi:hypothetical protein
MSETIPTSKDVVAYLNARFAEMGLPYRVQSVAVLPYVSPMWLANWDAPELVNLPDQDTVDEEIRKARWMFPQVLDEF